MPNNRVRLFKEIESSLTEVRGINPAKIVAFDELAGDAESSGAIRVIAEQLGERVDEVREAPLASRKALMKLLPDHPLKISIVRPGWLPPQETDEARRTAASEKLQAVLEQRKTGDLIRIGSPGENIDENIKDLFAEFGAYSRIRTPFIAQGPARIHVGGWVSLGRYGQILSLVDFSATPEFIRQHYPGISFLPEAVPFSRRNPTIVLHDGASLGDFFFIAAGCRIEIGRHVVTSQRLFLTDCGHVFDDPRLPVQMQGNTEGAPLIIEDSCWLGIGVSVIKAVRIGRHCVVGAGSVVTKNMPPYAVVGGAPARVIRLQNPNLVPAILNPRPPDKDAVIQIVRSIIESWAGHLLDADTELGAVGLYDQNVAGYLARQIPGYLPSVTPAMVNDAIAAAATIQALGLQIHKLLLERANASN